MFVIRYWPPGSIPSYFQGTILGLPVWGRLEEGHHFRTERNAERQLAALARHGIGYAVVPLKGEEGRTRTLRPKNSSRGIKGRRLVRRET
jgi:hypothetical protein